VRHFAGQAAARWCEDEREYYDTGDGGSREERICEEVVTFGPGCETTVSDTSVARHLKVGHAWMP